MQDWENKFRKHWPHHYRDVLDKVTSPLGMVVVNDTQTDFYPGCSRPLVRLERSFKQPIVYTIIVQDPGDGKILDEKRFPEADLVNAIRFFVEIIGGWEVQNN
jgi:hypothetical protein